MRTFTTRPSAGLLCLVTSGLLWGTGGLTGSLLGRVAGLSAIAVAACRLTAGGVLIVCYLTVARKTWPSGRAAWARITVIGLLAAIFQSCYFAAVSLTSVPLATLITIGAAPVIVLGAERAIGRPAGRLVVLTTGLAVTGREHGRPAGPARTADRRHPRGPAARRAAERDRDRRRGHHRRGRDPHRAGGSRRRPRWRRRWRRCSATPPPAATGAGSAGR